jgi:hypothetical protein
MMSAGLAWDIGTLVDEVAVNLAMEADPIDGWTIPHLVR